MSRVITSFVLNTLSEKGPMRDSDLDQYFYDCFDMRDWHITFVKKRMISFESRLRYLARKGIIKKQLLRKEKGVKRFMYSIGNFNGEVSIEKKEQPKTFLQKILSIF